MRGRGAARRGRGGKPVILNEGRQSQQARRDEDSARIESIDFGDLKQQCLEFIDHFESEERNQRLEQFKTRINQLPENQFSIQELIDIMRNVCNFVNEDLPEGLFPN